MRLSFWPLLDEAEPWSVERIAQEGAARGYQGADLRVAPATGPDRRSNVRLDASPAERDRIRSAFAAAGIEIACLNGYNDSPSGDDTAAWRAFEDGVDRHAELTEALGAGQLRLMVAHPEPASADWDAYLGRAWEAVGRALDRHPGVEVVVENHPGRATAVELFRAVEAAGDPRIRVALMPEHAVVMQEPLLALVERYAALIGRVCFSDRRVVADDLASFDGRRYTVRFEACDLGAGRVPFGGLLPRLERAGFDGYLVLKHEGVAGSGSELRLNSGRAALESFPAFVSDRLATAA